MLIIASQIDGRLRGGIRHPLGATEYALDAFSDGQLLDILSDNTLSVSVGLLVTPAKFDQLSRLRANWLDHLSKVGVTALDAEALEEAAEALEDAALREGASEKGRPKANKRSTPAKGAEG